MLVTGLVVAGFDAARALGRAPARAAAFFAAHEALPWVALGWALYGLFLVFVTIAGAREGHDAHLPGGGRGPGGQRRRRSCCSSGRSASPGAGIALVGRGDDRRRALGRLLVQVLEALALAARGVVGALVAVPAPVPELAAGARR